MNKSISIQGRRGSYSNIAAEHLFTKDIKLLMRDSFREVFEDVRSKKADYGVIPIENSTHGSVFENYDLLTKNELHIIKELYLKINFHLIGHPESSIDQITDLYTHFVAINQIQKFLQTNKQINVHEYPDTGGGVEMIKEKKLITSAGAASRLASEIFGMKVLKENIQDNPKNYTRFFVLSRDELFDKTSNKTTIEFGVKHESGTLVQVLKAFSEEDISLMKIESRPILNTKWEYRFYVDLLAGLYDIRMQKALGKVKKASSHLRILGTYLEGEYIET